MPQNRTSLISTVFAAALVTVCVSAAAAEEETVKGEAKVTNMRSSDLQSAFSAAVVKGVHALTGSTDGVSVKTEVASANIPVEKSPKKKIADFTASFVAAASVLSTMVNDDFGPTETSAWVRAQPSQEGLTLLSLEAGTATLNDLSGFRYKCVIEPALGSYYQLTCRFASFSKA